MKYVVHGLLTPTRNSRENIESRTVYTEYRKAFAQWKRYVIAGYRAAMICDGTILYQTSDYVSDIKAKRKRKGR